jgi:hypothetical protein
MPAVVYMMLYSIFEIIDTTSEDVKHIELIMDWREGYFTVRRFVRSVSAVIIYRSMCTIKASGHRR